MGDTHGDDSPSGKVHAFTHQVPAQTSLFTLQPRADSFNGPSGLLQRLRDAGDVVVHVRRNVELPTLINLSCSEECGRGRRTWSSCSNSVIICAGEPSCSLLRTLAEALMISPSLYVKSSSLRIAPPSTAILGRTYNARQPPIHQQLCRMRAYWGRRYGHDC